MLTIIKSQQTSGRTPLNQDGLSGFMFYGTAPSGWRHPRSSASPYGP